MLTPQTTITKIYALIETPSAPPNLEAVAMQSGWGELTVVHADKGTGYQISLSSSSKAEVLAALRAALDIIEPSLED